MSSAPSVTVVVPARDAAHLIGRQLDALAAQTIHDFEVVVADNGSTDGTARAAVSHPGGLDLRVVDASARRGVSHARNVGLRAGRAAKLLICDADDEVGTGWVAAMARALDDADLVSGRLDVDRLNPQALAAGFVSPTADGLPISMSFRPYVFGGNLGMRREILDRTGGFDEAYIEGHEDVEFSWRAQELGATLASANDAIVHYRLRASRRGTVRRQFLSGRSYAQLYRDHAGAGIPRTPIRTELRFYARLLASLPRDLRSGRTDVWVATGAWTLGRLAGDVRYGVRCPL